VFRNGCRTSARTRSRRGQPEAQESILLACVKPGSCSPVVGRRMDVLTAELVERAGLRSHSAGGRHSARGSGRHVTGVQLSHSRRRARWPPLAHYGPVSSRDHGTRPYPPGETATVRRRPHSAQNRGGRGAAAAGTRRDPQPVQWLRSHRSRRPCRSTQRTPSGRHRHPEVGQHLEVLVGGPSECRQ